MIYLLEECISGKLHYIFCNFEEGVSSDWRPSVELAYKGYDSSTTTTWGIHNETDRSKIIEYVEKFKIRCIAELESITELDHNYPELLL